MHDLEFDHHHVEPDPEVKEVAWSADNVELTTVGIDIGSSTSHLMFARVHLRRLSAAPSSRFVVVDREIIWQSPIRLTPYLPDYTIDVDELARFIGSCYTYAGVAQRKVDSGAVILTGEAIKRHNAGALAALFSEQAGRFVCASAGHHMECQMSAHGSGAVALSKGHGNTLLNIDIGGGTTKFALIERGEILATAAIAVGGRLLVENSEQGLIRIEDPARDIAASLGIELVLGKPLPPEDRARIVAAMTRLIMGMIDLREPSELARRLLVTEAWPKHLANKGIDAMTFGGGVAEYLFRREQQRFGDLGWDLAEELRRKLAPRRDLPEIWDTGYGIRATIIGAALFSAQVSGNTVLITEPDALPLRNLPVIACGFDLAEDPTPASVCGQVRKNLDDADFAEGAGPVALAFAWSGEPSHARLHAIASGICAALPNTIAKGHPLVLLIDGDVGMSLGRIIRHEIAANANMIAIDGVELKQFDYVDIGRVIDVTNVVPVIIKSLLLR